MSLASLIQFYHELSPESVARFPEFYSADAYFKDPFNEVRGLAPIQRIFHPHVYPGRRTAFRG
jgi:steroid delta-isomerase